TWASSEISHSIRRQVSARYLLLGSRPIVSPPGEQPVRLPRGPTGRVAVPKIRSGASFFRVLRNPTPLWYIASLPCRNSSLAWTLVRGRHPPGVPWRFWARSSHGVKAPAASSELTRDCLPSSESRRPPLA